MYVLVWWVWWFFYLLIYYLDSAEIVDIFTAEVLVPLVGSHIPV